MKNPIKPTLKTEILPLVLIGISIAISGYFYSNFPQLVATHWNFEGVIDGYSSREFTAFFFPAFSLGIYILFLVLPALDPKKKRYKEFEKIYHTFKNLIVGFLTIIYLLIGLNGLGYIVPMGIVMPIMVGILFIILGNFMGKIKSNWMMGLRTPWTLSSEEVWNKSHRFGGKIFMIAGLLLMIISILPNPVKIIVFFITIALTIITPVIYSLILYTQEQKKK